jgi:peptidoglycan/LPS O-acetylase OafA/YrhL
MLPSNLTLTRGESSLLATLGALLTNVFIVGQEISILMDADWLRLVGPAWSLSIELQFYLLAPFIVKRSLPVCAGIFALAIAARLSLLSWAFDPWRYFFPPAVYCFFLMGHLAHRLSVYIVSSTVKQQIGCAAIPLLCIIAWLCHVEEVKDLDRPELWVFYVAFAAAIPFIFELTKNNRIDAWIGDLSYPLYLVHRLVFLIFSMSLANTRRLGDLDPVWWIVGLIASIIAAITLHHIVEVPVNRLRERFRHAGSCHQASHYRPVTVGAVARVDNQ